MSKHQSDQIQNQKKTRAKRSRIWDYFKLNDETNNISCKVCDFNKTQEHSTTQYWNHLSTEHHILDSTVKFLGVKRRSSEFILSESENEDSSNEDSKEQIDNTLKKQSSKKQKTDQLLVQFLIEQNLPISVVQSEKFKQFLSQLNYKPPSRSTITNKLIPIMVNNIQN